MKNFITTFVISCIVTIVYLGLIFLITIISKEKYVAAAFGMTAGVLLQTIAMTIGVHNKE